MRNFRTKIGQAHTGHPRRAALAASLLLSLGAADTAAAADFLHLNWDAGCGASCFNAHGSYALTFSASSFGGPVDISRLLLDRRVLGDNAGSFFTVSFQLGGHQVASWGQWNMGSVAGDELTLLGSDLLWNPADGDLVLVLQRVWANGQIIGSDQGGGGFFVAPPEDQPPEQQPPGAGPGPDPDPGYFGGDITQGFSPPPQSDGPPTTEIGDAQSAAPEPAAWALLIGGLAMTGAALRRRRPGAAIAG